MSNLSKYAPSFIRDERDMKLIPPALFEAIIQEWQKADKPPYPFRLEVSFTTQPIEDK